jgi:hypothetical protein
MQHGADFRSIIEQWLVSRRKVLSPVVEPLSLDRLLVARGDLYLLFACEVCGAAYPSKQGLGLHRQRCFGYALPIRTMAWGSRCPLCSVEFCSRLRLIQHLAYDSKSCRTEFLDGEPLSLPMEVIKALDKRDAEGARADRRAGYPKDTLVCRRCLPCP